MELLIDFLCAIALALFLWGHRKHTLFSVGAAVICYLVALIAALFISVPFGHTVDEHLISSAVRTNAANDIADMYSAEHLETPEATLENMDMDQLFADEPEAFVKMVEQHQQSLVELRKTYRLEGEKAFLDLFTGDRSYAFSRAIAFTITFVLLALLLRLISKRLEENRPLAPKYRGIKKTMAMLLGLVVGVIMVTALAMILSWIIPYGAGAALFLNNQSWQQSFLYQLTSWLHIF